MRDKEYNKVYLKNYYQKHKEEHNEKVKRYYKDHKEIIDKHHRRWRLKRKYNITPEQYDEMYKQQSGCCLICGRHQSKMKERLCVDHNHETGQTRGLLCKRCNSQLGWYEEQKVNIDRYVGLWKLSKIG